MLHQKSQYPAFRPIFCLTPQCFCAARPLCSRLTMEAFRRAVLVPHVWLRGGGWVRLSQLKGPRLWPLSHPHPGLQAKPGSLWCASTMKRLEIILEISIFFCWQKQASYLNPNLEYTRYTCVPFLRSWFPGLSTSERKENHVFLFWFPMIRWFT